MTKARGGEEKKEKMSMEEYVNFFISRKSIDVTISFLNQIIRMHGFRKLHRTKKTIVESAVNAMDLLDLSRSTLKQTSSSSSSSSLASLTLDEVITDIEALKWHECCLTSVVQINSKEVTLPPVAKPKEKKLSNKRKIDTEKTKKKKRNSIKATTNGNFQLTIISLFCFSSLKKEFRKCCF